MTKKTTTKKTTTKKLATSFEPALATTVGFSLPVKLGVGDYHEFDYMEKVFNKITKLKVKVREVGHDYDTGEYVGIAYMGDLRQGANKELRDKLVKHCVASERERWDLAT